MSEKGGTVRFKTTVLDELPRLQFHLSNLLRGASESPTGHQPALDEVMLACKELLELLPVPARCSNCSTTNDETGTLDSCRHGVGEPPQRGAPFGTVSINHIIVLQVATSYAYALQLLDLAVDNHKTRARDLAPVTLGVFNLASQPAMSTSVGAYMMSSMVHQLRDAISLLMAEYQQGPPPPHASPTGSGLRVATVTNSIHTAVNIISENEMSLLEKLSQVMNDS